MAKKVLYILLLPLLLATGCQKGEQIRGVEPTELREVGKLELVEYRSEEIFVISADQRSISSIASIADIADYINNLLQVGNRIGIYSFDYYTIAYIDLNLLEDSNVIWDERSRAVQVTLPPIQVQPIGRGGEIRLLHERVNGTRRPITSGERQDMQRQAIGLAQKNLLPGTSEYAELVEKAENKARAYFTAVLRGGGAEEVTIRFKEL